MYQSVQLLSCVRLFATPWTAARQASLSITNSRSSLKLMSIESVMPSNHLILFCPLLLPPSIFPSIRVFSSESVLRTRWPKYWISASPSALPMNIQDWFPLGWTGWISLQSKGLKSVNTLNFNLCCQISFQKGFVLRPVKWPYPLRTYYQSSKFLLKLYLIVKLIVISLTSSKFECFLK